MKGLIDLTTVQIDIQSLIGTKETSKILGVSESTVRRLADSGKLPCVTVATTKYRKFNKDTVLKFKEEMYLVEEKKEEPIYPQPSFFELEDDSKIGMKSIRAKSHPAHYLMHKYWGRKPHNVVSDYIKYYTNIGDTVLDPFMGSGIVPIEAIKNERIGIGVDINPMSKFIAENTVSSVDIKEYKSLANIVITDIASDWNGLYETTCPTCGDVAHIEIAVWDNGVLARLKGKCATDGIFTKDADQQDIDKIEEIASLKAEYDNDGSISYPTDKVLQYVKRSGKERLDELFTDRALIILSKLRNRIREVDNVEMRNLLMFTFTSMLANVSNMLPGDLEKATYKSGWVISKFWTPKIHTERNIFHCFNLRVRAIAKGKTELTLVNNSLIYLFNEDSNHMAFIDNESIDYIFTDPPYGESIAYLALSQFWNGWLDNTVDYDNEIIVDSYRGKNYTDYSERMLTTFKEMYRVLKNKHYLSFTFHNRDLNVWKGVMDAVKHSGFVLKNITLQEQAVSSGTQGINKMNTLTGDFVYTLYKDTDVKPTLSSVVEPDKALEFVENTIAAIIDENKGITPSKLYEKLIPIIVHSETYLDENGYALDIEKILQTKYEYVELESENKIGDRYQWQLKK
ncbi:site-specific DNA-methyltransferase [Enterococcus faecalis]|nr:site-specific DNA-methyltransferase [Enterococcus faecalis]EPH71915.1 DNA (cytosine-5-)-methyltransferase [Enterococcus faecalis 20-SD-BW-06]EPI00081.1 DNA (cytosine-5-)-methyltransferase [Enterococcus faecalis 20-SD-BW-08]EGO8522308.1 helix-turn-helix domain-containing protein [Enterococcus faecalis]EHE8534156.1 site-specific DNA-methyltransferase [Enterococcus faecalis]